MNRKIKLLIFGIFIVSAIYLVFANGNFGVITNEKYTLAEKLANINLLPQEIHLFPTPKDKSGAISPTFEKKVLIQTKVDEHFPCHIKGENTIICKAINETKKEEYLSTLSPRDVSSLKSNYVPIKNIEGNLIKERNIRCDRDTEIRVDLSKDGTFIVGFGSNEFKIVTLSTGVFNYTHESGGDIYLDANELTGSYFSEIMDLNKTYSVVNVSFESYQAQGTDIGVMVRTHNMTNGTGLSSGLLSYWKLDSSNTLDYSGENITLTNVGATPIVNGRFDNAFDFDGTNDYMSAPDPALTNAMTISIWATIDSVNWNHLFSWHPGFAISGYGGSKIRLQFKTSSGTTSIWYGYVSDLGSGWHHYVATYDGSTVRIYLDGVQVDSASHTGNIDSTGDLRIGTYAGSPTETYCWDGKIDEVAIWNRALSGPEVSQLYNTQIQKWSDWTTKTYTEHTSISVDDGRYAQVKAELERASGGENVHLDSVAVGYTTGAPPPTPDYFPVVDSLDVQNGQSFTQSNVNLSATVSDDIQLLNASLYTNTTGTWHLNQTISISGTSNYTNFTIPSVADGEYIWNVLVCDNSTAHQCAFYSTNYSFSVSTACIDENCYPYVCNPETNNCYTSCTSHSHVNASSYCASDGTAQPARVDGLTCFNLEWPGLTDNEICTSQTEGYCFPDIAGSNEYCTDNANGCVENGVEYSEGTFICGYGDGANGHYQCLGGEAGWSGLTDCRDLGDPYDQSATYHSGGYCGYYYSETCDANSGCVPAVPATQDCGNYYYDGSTCGSTAADCDIGCGAPYDLSTCPSGLSDDCTSCNPPTSDEPPQVSLNSPAHDSIQNTLTVTMQYYVLDYHGMTNCSLWHNATGTWHLNATNKTPINYGGSVLNSFTVTFKDGDVVTWNVECYDNNETENQQGWGDSNQTFTIDTTYFKERKFRFYNGTKSISNEVFSVSQHGVVNATSDLYVGGDMQIIGNITSIGNVNILNLLSSLFTVKTPGLTGVELSSPYSEYLKFSGKSSNANLLFGLYKDNPLITTESGSYIEFGKDIKVRGDVETTTLNVTGNTYITHINPGGNPLYIGGEYEDGGITIQHGNLLVQNLTVNGTFKSEGNIQTNGSIIPDDTDIYDIGGPNAVWRHGFFRDINATTELYIDNAPVSPWLYNQTFVTYNNWGKYWYNMTLSAINWIKNNHIAFYNQSQTWSEQQNFTKGVGSEGCITIWVD